MIGPYADRPQAITLGADKTYHAEDFTNELRAMRVTTRGAEHQRPSFGDRRAHDAAWRLCRRRAQLEIARVRPLTAVKSTIGSSSSLIDTDQRWLLRPVL